LQQNAFSEHDFTCPLEKVAVFLSRLQVWWKQLLDTTSTLTRH